MENKTMVVFVQGKNKFNIPVGSLLGVQKSNSFSNGEIVFCKEDEFGLSHFGIIRGDEVEVDGEKFNLNHFECGVHIIVDGANNPNIKHAECKGVEQ